MISDPVANVLLRLDFDFEWLMFSKLMIEDNLLGVHSIGIYASQLAANYQPVPSGACLGGSWVTRRRPKSAEFKSSGV